MNWFRFHHSALHNPKVQRLEPELFKAWINLLCIGSAQENRWTLPCIEDVAFCLRLTTERTREVVSDLSKCGLLDKNEQGELVIHDWDKWQVPSDDSAERVARHRAANVTCNGDVTLQSRPRTDKRREEQNREEADLFADFWAVYPRKEARKRAEDSWRSLKPDKALTERIIADVNKRKASRQWQKDNGEFIPHASTYLNQRRWNDEETDNRPPNPHPGEWLWDAKHNQWRPPHKVGWVG